MIAFGHTAIGTVVGLYTYQLMGNDGLVSGLITAGTVGVVSHYIADFVPHGHFFRERDFKKKISIVILCDLLFSLIIFLGLSYMKFRFSSQFLYILFGIGGAQLPDVVEGLITIKVLPKVGFLKLESYFHNNVVHWHGFKELALLWGKRDIWQVAIVTVSLFLLLLK